MAAKFQLIFHKAENITAEVRHFYFKLAENQKLEFQAGQFISLHLMKDGKELRRNYSLANPPPAAGNLEFACDYIKGGLATGFLFNLEQGQAVDASGPYGQLILRQSAHPRRYIFLMTGTGVTPFLSMWPTLQQLMQEQSTEIVLLLGVKTRSDLLYGQQLLAWSEQYARFKFLACYSREDTLLAEHERKGYVQDQLSELNLSATNDVSYLCGNPNMVDAAFTLLQEYGLDRANIKREKYISGKS